MPIGRIGQEFKVNTTPVNTLVQLGPSVAVLADGRFVFVFGAEDTTGSAGVRARIYNADGMAVGGDFIVNSTTWAGQSMPMVTALAGGGFAVAWFSDYDERDGGQSIVARVFNANGTPAGADFLALTSKPGDQFDPAIVGLANGGFVVTWTGPEEFPAAETAFAGGYSAPRGQVSLTISLSTRHKTGTSGVLRSPRSPTGVLWQRGSPTIPAPREIMSEPVSSAPMAARWAATSSSIRRGPATT